MEDRLESEVRLDSVSESGASEQAPVGPSAAELPVEVKLLISRCMDGSETPTRPLKYYEHEKLSIRDVQAVMMRASGFKNSEVARLMEMNESTVSTLVGHPYGQKIIQAIVAHQGIRLMDVKTKLDVYADQMIDRMTQLAMQEPDLNLVQKVTFGLLDRAGYGPKSTIAHETEKSSSLASNSHLLSRIGEALSESSSVDRVARNFRQQPPPADAPGAVSRGPDARDSEAETPRSNAVPRAGLQISRTGT